MTTTTQKTSEAFENFLINKHAEQYRGLDDEMPEDYSDWLESIGTDGIITYVGEFLRLEESK